MRLLIIADEENTLILEETNCTDPFCVAALNVYRKKTISAGRALAELTCGCRDRQKTGGSRLS